MNLEEADKEPGRQDKKVESLFFARFSDGGYDVFTEEGYERIVKIFKSELKPGEGKFKVLDLGCGSGAFTKYLLRLSADIVGLDISYPLIKDAGSRSAAHFVVGDIEKLPFKDNTFDAVIFSAVLHHFPSLKEPVEEGCRVLKNQGRCFAFDPNNSNPFMWVLRNKKSPFYYSGGVTLNERPLAMKELRAIFCTSGFTKVKVFAISGIPFRYAHSLSIRMLLPFYNFLDKIFSRTRLAYRYGSFLLTVAEK